jgi:hypothetical protein
MAHSIHDTGYRVATSETRTVRGAIVFVALVAIALLAVAYPLLAAAAVVGGVGGHLAGTRAGPQRA